MIVSLECPGCGERLSIDMKECPSCHKPVVITTFNSVASMSGLELNKYANSYRKALAEDPDNKQLNLSIAMCYLKLKLYDKALPAFEKAIEDNFDNSESFFYAAVCLLHGKKAFLATRPDIDKIEEYINAAIMIEPKGIYYYFLAYIKYDYFFRKYYNTSPTYEEAAEMAMQAGLSETDVTMLYDILGVARPDCL
ncbi:MAG: tetratricopeptide repeat protein [Clostridia bacterium]|nr:tetratricopeptide repeat protein [Clostridia bacterium]